MKRNQQQPATPYEHSIFVNVAVYCCRAPILQTCRISWPIKVNERYKEAARLTPTCHLEPITAGQHDQIDRPIAVIGGRQLLVDSE